MVTRDQGVGTGETGTGTGRATESGGTGRGGDRTETPADPTTDRPAAGTGGRAGQPLQGPVEVTLETSPEGAPRLKLTIDRAVTRVGLREHESDDHLDGRIDQAIADLQQSHDPAAHTHAQMGVTTTEFGRGRAGEVGERRSGAATTEQEGSAAARRHPANGCRVRPGVPTHRPTRR